MPFEPFRTHTQPVNVADLEARFAAGDEVTPETLRAAGLAKRRHPVKVLGTGRADQEADRPRPRLQRRGEGEDREGRRHRGGRRRRPGRRQGCLSRARSRRSNSCCRRSSTPSGSPRSARSSPSRRRCCCSTGSAPTSRRRASTSTRSRTSSRTSPATTILGFLNLFSGGSLSRLSLFALGIMPYITASIILQLLTVVVPSLERLQKEGEVGQQKITQYTRYLTVALAFAQSLGYVFLFQSFQNQAGTSVVGTLTFAEAVPDRDRADRRHHPADVAGRADHPARDRQRDLADDLRLDRVADPERASRRGGRTPTRSSS